MIDCFRVASPTRGEARVELEVALLGHSLDLGRSQAFKSLSLSMSTSLSSNREQLPELCPWTSKALSSLAFVV